MDSQDNLIRQVTKPKCGRCFRDVEKATSQSIVVQGTPGHRLTYECHGETVSFDVTVDWYEKLVSEKKPFEESVFKPPLEVAPPKDQVIREEAVLRLREQRKVVAEFVETTIRSVIESHPSYKGTNLAEWCFHHSVRLESLYGHLLDHSRDVRQLVMGQRTVLGTFELPFFPDDTNMAWVSTPVLEKKAKP